MLIVVYHVYVWYSAPRDHQGVEEEGSPSSNSRGLERVDRSGRERSLRHERHPGVLGEHLCVVFVFKNDASQRY
jgi:hypothetical protein